MGSKRSPSMASQALRRLSDAHHNKVGKERAAKAKAADEADRRRMLQSGQAISVGALRRSGRSSPNAPPVAVVAKPPPRGRNQTKTAAKPNKRGKR